MPFHGLGLELPYSAILGASLWATPGSSADLDFLNGRYAGGSLGALISVSRASSATDLLSTSASGYAYNTYAGNVPAVSPSVGLLVFEARTNLFINSTAPVTQTITLPATGSYALWVNGSGSAAIAAGTATISGAGTSTNGTPVIISCTVTGTVTVTITGSLNAVQLEAGGFTTSFIVTGAASATRNADFVTASGALLTVLSGATGGLYVETGKTLGWTSGTAAFMISNSVTNRQLQTGQATNGSVTGMYNGGAALVATSGSGTYKSGIAKVSCTWAASARQIQMNNGTLATDANGPGANSGSYVIGSNNGSSNFYNGAFRRITAFPTTTLVPTA